MEQLSEMDYSLLQMENNRTFQHIAVVMFYDQTAVKGGEVRFKQILKVFERSLPRSRVFRRKLGGSTVGFDTPYWFEDPDFNLEFHVRHIALPRPGDWRQLCIQLARLHSRGIDLSRPPWEAYVIEGLNRVEGLPPGSFAIMLKIHHAAVDGVAMAKILDGLHSLTGDPEPPQLPDEWQGESEPSPREVWSRALRKTVSRPAKLAEALRETVPRMIKANRGSPMNEQFSESFKTRFNTRISPHRVVDGIILDLEQVKAVKRAVDETTVNDVIVSTVGGALRRYLQSKGELPERSLMAGAPISVRLESGSDPWGNQLGIMWIKLATDVEDALERLRAVNASSREAKDYANAMGSRMMLDMGEGMGPMLFGAVTKLGSRMNQHTVVSNVPGPQVPLYLAGARLHSLLALGPLMDGTGLFHGVISGGGRISITFVACREMIPDPEFYRECLQQAWDQLQAATLAQGRTKPRASKTATRAVRKKRAKISPAGVAPKKRSGKKRGG